MSIGALLIAFALWQLYGTAIAESCTNRTAWPSGSNAEVHAHHGGAKGLTLLPATAQAARTTRSDR